MDSWASRQELVSGVYRLLDKDVPPSEIEGVASSYSFLKRDLDVLSVLLLSKEGFDNVSQGAMDTHLYLMHNARLKMVKHLLPAGDVILDLGGANAPLHHMGYPHDYSKIVLIDLPTEERHKDFQVVLEDTGGKVILRYEDMTDLTVSTWSGLARASSMSPPPKVRECVRKPIGSSDREGASAWIHQTGTSVACMPPRSETSSFIRITRLNTRRIS